MDPLLRSLDVIRACEYDRMDPDLDVEEVTDEEIEDMRIYYAEQRYDAAREG